MIGLALALIMLAPDAATISARRHFDEARTQYDIGRFEEALGGFERAYAAKPLPALLFNIGQCHFQVGRFERAAFFYDRYLTLEPQAPDRAVVEELLVEARAHAARDQEADTAAMASAEFPWLWVGVASGTAAAAAVGTVLYFALTSGGEPSLGVLDRSGP